MDLRLYGRTLWRYRAIVAIGLVLGCALAALSFVRVSADGSLVPRQSELWASYSTLFVTQQGFPWGRSSIPIDSPPTPLPGAPASTFTPGFADPDRFTQLATLYAQLIRSDPVLSRVLGGRDLPVGASVDAQTVFDPISRAQLPLVRITATGTSPQSAVALVGRVTTAFKDYLRHQQAASGIPHGQRVAVEVVNQPGFVTPGGAELIQGRSLTRPLVVLIAFLIATIGLVFILENLRQSKTAATAGRGSAPEPEPERARLVVGEPRSRRS